MQILVLGLRHMPKKTQTQNSKSYGTTLVLDQRKEEVFELLGRGIPAEEVAKKFGVSRRSLFYWLKKQGVTIKQLQEEYRKKLEEKERAKKEKMARLGAVPTSFEEFLKLEEIKKFYDWLRARNVTTSEEIVGTIHKVCMELNIHPLMLLEEEGKDKLTSFLAEAKERYAKQTLESYKAHIRLWYKFNEQQPPAILTLERYKSKVAHLAWFDAEDRLRILETAKKMLKTDEYDKLRAALMFLFYTGSRAEALKNVKFEERKIKVNGKEIPAVIAITLEKGRHGKKQWEKPIKPEIYFKYIKGRLPFSEKELKWIRNTLKKIYMKIAEEEGLKVEEVIENKGRRKRKKYIVHGSIKLTYALNHQIHIWRHTAAMTLLHATDWNIGLVSEILGWENPEILYQVYGRMPPEKKIAVVYGVEYEKPKFEYVYGEWEKKARELGLL